MTNAPAMPLSAAEQQQLDDLEAVEREEAGMLSSAEALDLVYLRNRRDGTDPCNGRWEIRHLRNSDCIVVDVDEEMCREAEWCERHGVEEVPGT